MNSTGRILGKTGNCSVELSKIGGISVAMVSWNREGHQVENKALTCKGRLSAALMARLFGYNFSLNKRPTKFL